MAGLWEIEPRKAQYPDPAISWTDPQNIIIESKFKCLWGSIKEKKERKKKEKKEEKEASTKDEFENHATNKTQEVKISENKTGNKIPYKT